MSDKSNGNLKIVIVGGVAGGASAAAKARRVNEQAEIILIEKGPYVSYANCGLPYHISGEITDRNDLFVATPELLAGRFNIDVRTDSEVVAIDPERQAVQVTKSADNTTYEETYDKLILAPGTAPIVPPIPGIDADGIFTLKTVRDMDRVLAYLDREKPAEAVVVGGGFIGVETAEALRARKIDVTVAEAAPQILLPWDPDMADIVERYMTDTLWIDIEKDDPVSAFENANGKVTGVVLKSGEKLSADLVILAIGTKPLTGLAEAAGLTMGRGGLIATCDRMQTSDPHIYAVGDAVQVKHRVTGQPVWLPLAGPANRQGRTAGANAAGGDAHFPGVIGTSVLRVGKLTAARTGLNEKEAREAGLDYFTSVTSGMSHADYFPDADEMLLKLLVEKPGGRLLGAQVVGRGGVDKRIDVFATAIVAGMTVGDIADLELAYAPPYGSAKDPVNIAAMAAENSLNGVTRTVTWRSHFNEDPRPRTLDVRSADERKTVYAADTEHVPLETLRERAADMDRDAPVRIHCRIGQRGYYAEQILKGRGFKDVANIAGGWRAMWGDELDDKLFGGEPEPED